MFLILGTISNVFVSLAWARTFSIWFWDKHRKKTKVAAIKGSVRLRECSNMIQLMFIWRAWNGEKKRIHIHTRNKQSKQSERTNERANQMCTEGNIQINIWFVVSLVDVDIIFPLLFSLSSYMQWNLLSKSLNRCKANIKYKKNDNNRHKCHQFEYQTRVLLFC